MPILRSLLLIPVLLCASPVAARVQEEVTIVASKEAPTRWKRAETPNFIVYSDGSAEELARTGRTLEALRHLLARLYRGGDQTPDPVKLRVTLIDSADRFRALGLVSPRAQGGPYPKAFGDDRFYDPRDDGPVLAVVRVDQIIRLNTNRRYNLDCDDHQAEGGGGMCGSLPAPPPAPRAWEEALYAGVAQHFILTYAHAAYPRWYLDGVGALFSTIRLRRDGALDYAAPPGPLRDVFRSYGDLDAGTVLSAGDPDADADRVWSPYHAWLLAHYFLYSKLDAERARQFGAYMAAVRQGAPLAEAAKAFGDLTRLRRELLRYAGKPAEYARTRPIPVEEPVVIGVTPAAAAVAEARLELASRLADPQGFGAWLTALRDQVTQLSYDETAYLFLAEAACRAGRPDECLTASETVLARAPHHREAALWQGWALTDRALAAPAAERPARLEAARAAIRHAMQQVGDRTPLAPIALFRSFARAGEPVPDAVLRDMADTVRLFPAAPGLRLMLGEELVRQGKVELGRNLLHPLLYGGYDSPERSAAWRLFAVD